MFFTVILNIDPTNLQKELIDVHAKKIESITTHFQEYDIEKGRLFIPPIYYSAKLNDFFPKLTELTSSSLTLIEQKYQLIIKKQLPLCKIILSSHNETKKFSLTLTYFQYKNLIKVLEAGGMYEVCAFDRKVITYTYKHTVYTIHSWLHIPSFLYVRSTTMKHLIEGLAMIGYSIDSTVNWTIREVYRHYNIPSVFIAW